jgi:ribosomal protein S18 acetylase RimI-like enzyme
MAQNSWPHVSLVFPEHDAEAAAVLSRAFVADPLILAISPEPKEPEERGRRLTGLFATAIRAHRAAGQPVFGVFEDGRVVAGAVVEGTTHPAAASTVFNGLMTLPTMVKSVGWDGTWRAIKLVDILARNHPPKPHLYLNILGVEPAFQGRHCGVVILDHLYELVMARSDLAGVYLETATESNVAYYTRNGYEVIGEFNPLGVRMWRMFQPRRRVGSGQSPQNAAPA